MARRIKPAVSVFDYTDYRRYLFDFYNYRKRVEVSFTYRSFAAKAGLTSVGLYKEIVDGKRNLSDSQIVKFSAGLGHTRAEADYFTSLVAFNDAPDVDSQKACFRKMLSCYDSRVYRLNADQFEYFSRWYYVAVREVLACGKYTEDDAPEIARLLSPTIRVDQVRKAFEVLSRLGLIAAGVNGVFARADAVVTTGYPEEDSQAVKVALVDFQKGMMEVASGAFDRFPLSDMDMSTLTLAVSKETYAAMKDELARLRKRFLEMAAADAAPQSVYQLNCQFFPLVRHADAEGGAQ